MAAPSTPPRRVRSATSPLRVRLAGPVELQQRAAWALEALLARIHVERWQLVDADDDADLGWGTRGHALTLPCEPEAWAFRPGAEPDPARDPLATSFWWLARVEEQLADVDAFDEHDRFRFAASALAQRDDPLDAPVDELALDLAERLEPWRVPPPAETPAWRIVASHDVDLPWRWTRAGRRRALRSVRDELRRGRVGAAIRTTLALASIPTWWLRRRDPWLNARRIVQFEASHGARSTHYLLAGRHAPEDGDAELHERGARYVEELVALEADATNLAGLHGSYTAGEVDGRLAEERAALEQRFGRPVRDHRFHYLRHRPVDAWPRLAAAGMRSDASLGYAEQPGFRAGTAHPYRAWDHAADAPLDLVVIPLALMDATFDERYLGLGAGWAAQRLAVQVVERVRELGGSASVLIHNDRLCNTSAAGWTKLYATLLEQVREAGGSACTAAEAAEAYLARIPAWRRSTTP